MSDRNEIAELLRFADYGPEGLHAAGHLADAVLSSDWLARVKREAGAAALEAEVALLRGYTLDHRSAGSMFDHLIRLIERDAAMLREQVQ